MPDKSRHAQALEFALHTLLSCAYKNHIQAVYLYGSCARAQQKHTSDVDLFVCVDTMNPKMQRKLRLWVTPDDLSLPEVELKFGSMEDLKSSSDIFYRNIRKDGKLLWERKAITTLQKMTTSI